MEEIEIMPGYFRYDSEHLTILRMSSINGIRNLYQNNDISIVGNYIGLSPYLYVGKSRNLIKRLSTNHHKLGNAKKLKELYIITYKDCPFMDVFHLFMEEYLFTLMFQNNWPMLTKTKPIGVESIDTQTTIKRSEYFVQVKKELEIYFHQTPMPLRIFHPCEYPMTKFTTDQNETYYRKTFIDQFDLDNRLVPGTNRKFTEKEKNENIFLVSTSYGDIYSLIYVSDPDYVYSNNNKTRKNSNLFNVDIVVLSGSHGTFKRKKTSQIYQQTTNFLLDVQDGINGHMNILSEIDKTFIVTQDVRCGSFSEAVKFITGHQKNKDHARLYSTMKVISEIALEKISKKEYIQNYAHKGVYELF